MAIDVIGEGRVTKYGGEAHAILKEAYTIEQGSNKESGNDETERKLLREDSSSR